jgi:hypothetical protein
MRAFVLTALASVTSILVAGCSGLVPARTDAYSVSFSVSRYARVPNHLVLTTTDGSPVANGTFYRGGVVFRLPTDQRWASSSGQCLQVRSITGQQLSVSGVDSAGFILPDWNAGMRSTYEGGYLQQQRVRLAQQINVDTTTYQNAQAWMQRNPGMYSNGVCQTPNRSAQPSDACGTPQVAESIAMHRCAEHVGCVALGDTAGKFAGDLKELTEFAAENLCDAHFMSLHGESYTSETFGAAVGSLIVTKMAALALEGVGYNESDANKYARDGMVALEFMSCVTRETNRCTAKYQSWLNGPQDAHETCVAAVGVLQTTPQKIEQEKALLQSVDRDMAALRAQTSYQRGPGARLVSCKAQ